ncbi:H-NS histone family protein [Paraburkholderia nemoris]|uniref:H-NS family nucleoid-associated regulatory protein n=1 Tax=Paraburkholderia nemoris TaxID=2793076 RepID=UPI0038B9371F
MTLRDRFARLLRVPGAPPVPVPEDAVNDEVVLELLLHLRVESNTDETKARSIYELERKRYAEQPTFDELATRGWVLPVWERANTPREAYFALKRESECSLPALLAWLDARYDLNYTWDAEPPNGELKLLVDSVVSQDVRPETIVCQSPDWVAARLWERLGADGLQPLVRLKLWYQAWCHLRYPKVVPMQLWAQAQHDLFIEAAFSVLYGAQGLPDATAVKMRYAQLIANGQLRDPQDLANFVPEFPETLVDRAQWLSSPVVEQPTWQMLDAAGSLYSLCLFLVDEICAAQHSAAPHPVAERLLALSEKYPDILNFLLRLIEGRPQLLAEMLLVPKFSALACLLIARWKIHTDAWDRELVTPELEDARDTAFADGVAFLGHHLVSGQLAPAEVASLFRALHTDVKVGNIVDVQGGETNLAVLRSTILAQSKDVLLSVFRSLVGVARKLRLGNAEFSAALDLLDSGQLVGDIAPEPLVSAYINSVVSDEYVLSAARVSSNAAAALYELAKQADVTIFNEFLFPFRLKERLKAAENIYTVRDELARGVQVHMRVLARAVVGHSQPVPQDLFAALLKTVRAGAIEHDSKGRVAAMAVRHDMNPFRGKTDRPLATDLGAALDVLDSAKATQFLDAILETDEPAFLAQLLVAIPQEFKPRIEQRIEALAPDDAGETLWLTDRFVRIDELLNAGALDAASAYIAADDDGSTEFLKRVALFRLRVKLRLALLKRDWPAITSAEIPPEVQQSERDAARDIILFYQGAANLEREDGDAAAAESIFAALHSRNPKVAAYALNLFAARVRLVIGDNLFARVRGETLTRAIEYVADAERWERTVELSETESVAYLSNKAVLLLAASRNDEAATILRPLLGTRLNDRVAALNAVAIARTGRMAEALKAMDWAESKLESSAVLTEARRHLGGGRHTPMRVSISESDNPLPLITEAIGHMLRLAPEEQALVWRGNPRPFEQFITEHVRYASASVTSLIPRLKVVSIDSKEDDTSAVIRELLRSRLAFINWNVAGQTPDGFTAKENPGERDLAIVKDSSDLAVIEAVVCKRSPNSEWMQKDLKSHFQKLLAYSTCRLFFHLTYAYVEQLDEVVQELQKIAKNDAPSHCKLLGITSIETMDSRPRGFEARYSSRVGEIAVVFLVLDMQQAHMRNAAKLAGSNEARKPRQSRKQDSSEVADKVVAAGASKDVAEAIYRDPNSGATWSGRGRPPNWIANAKNRSRFLIAGAAAGVSQPKTKADKALPVAQRPAVKSVAVQKSASNARKNSPSKAASSKMVAKSAAPK